MPALTSNERAVLNLTDADMGGSSLAAANLLVQATQVKSADAVFECVLEDVDALKILNAFKVSSADANLTNAEVEVALEDKADFIAAILAAWQDAADGTHAVTGQGSAQADIKKYFVELIRAVVDGNLEADGFSNLLQAGKLDSLSVTFQDSVGATAMGTNVEAAGAAAHRVALVKQNDEADLEHYYGGMGDNNDAYFLPIKAGKSLTFFFNTTVTEPSGISLVGPNSTTSVNGGGYSPAFLSTQSTNSGSHTKMIALICHLGSKNAYYARDISGAFVMPGAALVGADQAAKILDARKNILSSAAGLAVPSTWTTTDPIATLAAATSDALMYAYAKAQLMHEMNTVWTNGAPLDSFTGSTAVDRVAARPNFS